MSVALSYRLTTKCGNARPFCRTCTNSFKLNTCDPRCTEGPTTICLIPRITGGTTTCSACKDDIIPLKFIVVVRNADGDVIIGPYFTTTSPRPLSCEPLEDCGTAPAPFLFDGGDGGDLDPANLDVVFCTETGFWTFSTGPGTGVTFNYEFDTDITTGDGCNQILTLSNIGGTTVSGPFPPDGSTITLYPITEDLL